ncbi:2-vinyl bacteriochlorophyllide hydratase [Prosthecochloris sp. N3]|uniref:2-vinyl bacteriochlorophyllide hydratase n=1 Tax=Prosthecochloris ethylica TaxID=2743976 RepID=A0ABR9XR91_9CHLB|nr:MULTISPECIES: 2-vinyl bacteriochlorophyllide hydratase [Prosthecochloris]MEC9486795.1 2-vinyl bacteriochlorophyllide hydratase [Prosthecochloris sp.]MBF0585539.1 2-vinyl bacteriochlorophyllide hydratase [Prosthecochloris ethylica]MBF0636325.1 2-vinyl bacteriochlorophyllide hydratase [Prosthecochloris ethylica]NUK46769.1 2-vinyl bacteriochlorophyllide hydratase [Prosthecochloris ethylica]RNA64650.1 2-vinyl bacteriochlorophyllide hydratase [Prosthecochloris sp. ZM_2]
MPRYTPEQLAKRNASVWTTVQAILAPIQFLVFLAGLTITWLYKAGIWIDDFSWVTIFVILKTFILILIFVTGAFFEKEVFDEYVFAPEFFWEDVGSAVAMVVHITYFVLFFIGLDENTLIWTAFLAYLSYLVNATQFVIRLILEKRHEKRTSRQQTA